MRPQPATAPDPSPDHAPACDAAAERAAARLERHLAVLDEVMESALRVTLALERRCVAAAEPAEVEGESAPDPVEPPAGPAPASSKALAELALAYARASRAVRMSVVLQDRLIKEAQAPGGAAPPGQTHLRVTFVDPSDPHSIDALNARYAASGACPAPPPAPQPAPMASRAEVESVVRSVAKSSLLPGEHSPREAAEIVERLVREAAERLESEDEFEALMRRPVSEIVERICRDIDMTPPWDRLAEEPWALREIASGRPGAPLAAVRRGPPPSPHPVHPREGGEPGSLSSPRSPGEQAPHAASP